MKFSELWLREWVNLPVDSVTLAKKITMSGLKVNVVEPVSLYFTGVVIGNIIDVKVHPDNCNLLVNTIDTGHVGVFKIISNSKRCKKNIRVAVALRGANLPNNLQVKCIQIQNELSEGILCSFKSLGIIYHDIIINNSIIELPMDAPLGQDLRTYLQLDDNIFDISITPNRGDCLNLMGIAHDIAAIYRLPIQYPKIDHVIPTIDDVVSISIDVPEACPCYFGRILKNIDTSISTPLWMKEKLRRSGVMISNIVMDIINYVLLELGQPIHIFDLNDIHGGINVRFAAQKETIAISYDNEIALSPDTLIIADHTGPLEIAGISVKNFDTLNFSKISNIFLGSAFFNSLHIIRSIKRYGITTYSSQYYERNGINPEVSELALERATFFLLRMCGGGSGAITSVINQNMLPKKNAIILYRSTLNRLLGYIISNNEIVDILIHLGCSVQIYQKDVSWIVLVPTWRFDIKIEEDLIAEIVRLHGYDKIAEVSVYAKLHINKHIKNNFSLSRIKTLLVDLGYQEIITYSFVNHDIQNLLYPHNLPIKLFNPLTNDMSVMRLSLLVGLLNTLIYNQNRQQKNIRLFECGQCFLPNRSNIDNKIHQHLMLSGIITGERFDDHWDVLSRSLDFYDIKGDIEALLEFMGQLNDIEFKSTNVYLPLHPGQSASIFLREEYVGFVGVIHPILAKKLKLKTTTCAFELFWDKISQNKMTLKNIIIPKFPINRRDISIIVPEHISAGEIIFECKKTIKDKLIDITLFDIYRGHGIPNGFKSLSISLYIYHTAHTLQEKEIKLIIQECIFVLKNRFQVLLRDK
ncbi:phenylalanine--tRNA ligase subunit beta [Blochmannia endosymbiont of Polyrhachis (Hedomyrma) turneri]|uniref:phenylalanine--tRNA ligase subunit beta n=1 Tax=Blochmannia endosymbiont of Polyrhachis (Hedomyrma) turneri TaxID=1505596 RepID=UPI00061A7C1E|nr:phenylalanine--tRNA ligase subunit beta [Blochmannia endosymbiont of Polyrhachis (Hedomyrma) turneri]AKC59918.1 Phenylalanine--tRNA ligase beta subunit [Blochmannia endosymbiont of Polyrhachis (Hedomyrma) turneri]